MSEAADTPDLTPADTNVMADQDTDDVKILDDSGNAGESDDKSKGDDKSKDDDKSADDKSKDNTDEGESKADDVASYKLPDGMELNADEKSALDGVFAKHSLNSEQAQGIIDFMIDQAKADTSAQGDANDQRLKDWATECRNDKEVGGEAFAQNQGVAKKAIDTFGTPELKEMLNDTGYQAHPEFFRFMVKVGKTLKEDDPGGLGGQGEKQTDRVNRMYPNDKNNKT